MSREKAPVEPLFGYAFCIPMHPHLTTASPRRQNTGFSSGQHPCVQFVQQSVWSNSNRGRHKIRYIGSCLTFLCRRSCISPAWGTPWPCSPHYSSRGTTPGFSGDSQTMRDSWLSLWHYNRGWPGQRRVIWPSSLQARNISPLTEKLLRRLTLSCRPGSHHLVAQAYSWMKLQERHPLVGCGCPQDVGLVGKCQNLAANRGLSQGCREQKGQRSWSGIIEFVCCLFIVTATP